MLTFDATSREVCAVKRLPTATPLQTLVLLNDPQYVEAWPSDRPACCSRGRVDRGRPRGVHPPVADPALALATASCWPSRPSTANSMTSFAPAKPMPRSFLLLAMPLAT